MLAPWLRQRLPAPPLRGGSSPPAHPFTPRRAVHERTGGPPAGFLPRPAFKPAASRRIAPARPPVYPASSGARTSGRAARPRLPRGNGWVGGWVGKSAAKRRPGKAARQPPRSDNPYPGPAQSRRRPRRPVQRKAGDSPAPAQPQSRRRPQIPAQPKADVDPEPPVQRKVSNSPAPGQDKARPSPALPRAGATAWGGGPCTPALTGLSGRHSRTCSSPGTPAAPRTSPPPSPAPAKPSPGR